MTITRYQNRALDRVIGVVFEGIGNDPSFSKGLAFYLGRVDYNGGTFEGVADDYEWLPGLISVPDSIRASVNPFTGEFESGGIAVSIALGDTAAVALQYQQGRTPLTLTTGLNTVQITLTIEDRTGSGAEAGLAGSVVWIGDEAILLGTYSGGGTYADCERAYYSTIAAPHSVADGDPFVYTANPYLLGRRATLVLYNKATDTISERFYFLNQRPKSNDTGTALNLNLLDFGSLLLGASINQGHDPTMMQGVLQFLEGVSVTQKALTADFSGGRRIFKDQGTQINTWWEAADTINLASSEDQQNTLIANGPRAWAGAPEVEVEEDREPFYDETHQLFVVRKSSLALSEDALSSTQYLGADIYRHAWAIFIGFLRSGFSDVVDGFDAWRGDWGAGYPAAFFDIDDITAKIEANPEMQVDQLVLGSGGEEYTIAKLIEILLVPYFAVLATKQDGRVIIGPFRPLNIADFAAAIDESVEPVPIKLGWEVNANADFTAISAEIGELPWEKPRPIKLNSRDGFRRDTQRRATQASRRARVIDYRTRSKGSPPGDIVSDILSRIQLGLDQVPQISFSVAPSEVTGIDYDLMKWVTIAAPALANPWFVWQGERIRFDPTNPALAGLLVSRRENLSTGLVDLTLLLLNFANIDFVRWRAPTGEVASYNAGTFEITCEPNTFSEFDADASYFSVGDKVDFFYPDFALAAIGPEALEVVLVTGNVIELSGGTTTTPAAGWLVRLSRLSANPNSGPFAGFRAHVFSSDILDTTSPGDIYG